MNFILEFVIKFLLFDIHKKYFSALFRFLIILGQNFGIKFMLLNLFQPLFGFKGIISRINGVVFRSFAVVIGLIIIIAIFFIGFFIYPLVIYVLLRISLLYGAWIIPLILCLVFLGFSYYYYNSPVLKIKDSFSDSSLRLTGDKNTRKILRSLIDGNLNNTTELLFKDREYLTFCKYAELDHEKVKDFINSGLSLITADQIIKNIREISGLIDIKFTSQYLITTSFIRANPTKEGFLEKQGTNIVEVLETLRYINFLGVSPPNIFSDDFKLHPAGGIDKAWAIGYTEVLNKYSTDFTKLALKGYMPTLIGRTKIKEQVLNILTKPSRNNVMLIGDPGCGKTTFVKALAKEIATGTEIKVLSHKRIVSLDVGALTSGLQGEINDRLSKLTKEINASRNVILFIDEIHNLSSTLAKDPNAVSVFGILEPYISSGNFAFIASTSVENYTKYIEPNEGFSKNFDIVRMPPATREESILISENEIKTKMFNYRYLITYKAIVKTIEYAEMYISNKVLPDSAMEFLNQAVGYAQNEKLTLIDSNVVSSVVSQSVGVPVDKVSESDAEKLLKLEQTLHQHVIGQNYAIKQISDAIKRSRVRVRDSKKPIASFLFIGPTGVGKTETAKALAYQYFGREEEMLRFDMSEFQEISSMTRLIGSDNGEIGRLTSYVKQRPYTLILIDEIEKAHKNIQNLFLQVLDDGILTSSSGETVSFAHTFIIMTSNAGARDIIKAIADNRTYDEIKQIVLASSQNYFRPEFLNRFTAVIPFSPLSDKEIYLIAKLKLSKVTDALKQQHIYVSFDDAAITKLSLMGYDPQWGARMLNRTIEEKVETKLADKILSKEIQTGDHYTFTAADLL
jgi:ATP-dependent Clp protease ATP-binding subunit ClpC